MPASRSRIDGAQHAPVLEAVRLRRRAEDGTVLLDDVSLHVSAGDSVGILGPPGAGKTLLMRALALLDPLEEGELRWHGESVSPEGVPSFRRHVLYVQQRATVIEGTVVDNLELPFTFRCAGNSRFDRKRILPWLAAVGREESFLERAVADLSGGELQLVALFRALQLDPDVLLLDEPTSSLDEQTRTHVEHLLLEWRECANRDIAPSLVIITHNESQAERLCGRRIRLERGRMVTGSAPGSP